MSLYTACVWSAVVLVALRLWWVAVIADAAVVLGAQHLLIRPGREVGFADLVNFSTRPADYREGLKVLPDLQSCHVLSMAEYIGGRLAFVGLGSKCLPCSHDCASTSLVNEVMLFRYSVHPKGLDPFQAAKALHLRVQEGLSWEQSAFHGSHSLWRSARPGGF